MVDTEMLLSDCTKLHLHLITHKSAGVSSFPVRSLVVRLNRSVLRFDTEFVDFNNGTNVSAMSQCAMFLQFFTVVNTQKAKIWHNLHNLHFMYQSLDPIWHYLSALDSDFPSLHSDVNDTSPCCQNTTQNVQLLHSLLK